MRPVAHRRRGLGRCPRARGPGRGRDPGELGSNRPRSWTDAISRPSQPAGEATMGEADSADMGRVHSIMLRPLSQHPGDQPAPLSRAAPQSQHLAYDARVSHAEALMRGRSQQSGRSSRPQRRRREAGGKAPSCCGAAARYFARPANPRGAAEADQIRRRPRPTLEVLAVQPEAVDRMGKKPISRVSGARPRTPTSVHAAGAGWCRPQQDDRRDDRENLPTPASVKPG